MNIDSKLTSLADIVAKSPDWSFNIPIYQRLYVWGEDQVLTLLNDVVNAYECGADLFFLGGTLLVEQEAEAGRSFDLIDGQQRFTTLWLLCHAWRGELMPFLTIKAGEYDVPRLRFAIRPEVNQFLHTLAFGFNGKPAADVEATQRMRTALALMSSLFEKRSLPPGVASKEDHLAGLAEFVFTKVKFVVTSVPHETDLNKLFEVINNRGVQLQHHEILKARMLDALLEEERNSFAVLWEACADMDNFVERNLSAISGVPAHEITVLYERKHLSDADAVMCALQSRRQEHSGHHVLTLEDILAEEEEQDSQQDQSGVTEAEQSWVRSMFGFPLFLQHTLRIWLHQRRRGDLPRLLDRELQQLFESHFFNDDAERADNVRSFISLLWKLRVLFDEHMIKWADQGEEEIHLISKITVSSSNGKRYMSRARGVDSNRGFSLLQSMLYHSQEITTQYWLTPLLMYIHDHPEAEVEQYFIYLRHLDNHLLGSAYDEPLVRRTLNFMSEPWLRSELIHQHALNETSGLRFAHYWFYKLEFVLWFQRVRPVEAWAKFRLTAKSSVEHISPQTPTDRDHNRVIENLDNFGNLALVSRSLNSEYSNLPYNEKRQRFINNNRGRLDSLKMDLIYQNVNWGDNQAAAHQMKMIECLEAYCEATPAA
ncbi:DUF262 domain-containing HNH endonuclease family protein [Synechococcus sp. CS-1325]|uniref:DUF262 domain-containing protein n=1 Tax=Synechococcus sp. CS-1325 TaxID=2847979 RepID=UPI000DB8C9C9|nr:DUF262 domain-containing HNH endonuclease family protein [Synechococcus sp. CS-1325]MCT0199077.1 DUF262 domain-containing HNH endonuclease family protein [Synechococcus sp. CS-1325]PZU99506.1 MAG: DUF262 domain-containing protein [Cyanobium sp.]